MELRQYLRILLGKWWIIIPLTLMGFTYSLVFSYSRTPIYQSSSTYVTALDSSLYTTGEGDALYGFDSLTGADQRIFVTYCSVLTSQVVISRAYTLLNVQNNSVDPSDYKVTCSNLPETNVLLLTVTGPAPKVVEKLNEAIGTTGLVETNALYRLFPLKKLDPVGLEPDPISPKIPQNAALGTGVGLILGISLAFLIEYFQAPSTRLEALSIRNAQMGVYNERYFRQRFEQEINRAHARNRPISMAMLNLIPNEDFRLLPENAQVTLYRMAAVMTEDRVGKDNIVAYLRPQTLGILLAETPADQAQELLEKLHGEIRKHHFESDGYSTTFVANSGLVTSSGAALDYYGMLDKASEALKVANKAGENTIHLIRATPLPFVLPEMEPEAPGMGGSVSFDELSWPDEDVQTPAQPVLDMPAVSTAAPRKTSNGQAQPHAVPASTSKPKAGSSDPGGIERSLLTRLREDLSRASNQPSDTSEPNEPPSQS